MKLYVAKTRDLKDGVMVEGFRYLSNPKPKNDYDKFVGVYWNCYLKGLKTKDLNLVNNLPINVIYDETKKSYILNKEEAK